MPSQERRSAAAIGAMVGAVPLMAEDVFANACSSRVEPLK